MRIWVLHARRRGLLRCGVGLVLMKLKLQKQMRKTQQTIANKSQETRKEVASWPNLPSNLATFSKAKTGCCSCIIIIKRIKPTSTNFKWPNLDNSKHNNLFIILFKWINKTLKMLTTCSRSEFYINKSTFVLFPHLANLWHQQNMIGPLTNSKHIVVHSLSLVLLLAQTHTHTVSAKIISHSNNQ